jgi:hypothetical protein
VQIRGKAQADLLRWSDVSRHAFSIISQLPLDYRDSTYRYIGYPGYARIAKARMNALKVFAIGAESVVMPATDGGPLAGASVGTWTASGGPARFT